MIKPILCLLLFLSALSSLAQDTVAINSSIHYQTIKGWGAEGGQNTQYEGVPQYLITQIINESVKDLGLDGLRYESWQGNSSLSYGQHHTWEFTNDNGSPDTLVSSSLDTGQVDYYMKNLFVPWRDSVRAMGDTFNFYFSPSWYTGGSTGNIPAFLQYSPGEYAEYFISNLNYLKNKYGLIANYADMCNEAGNGNVFTPQLVGTMIKTVAPRMQAAGLSTAIMFPECVSAQTSWQYIQAEAGDSGIWPYIKCLSYHLYGTNDPYRAMIDSFAQTRGLLTAQTEYIGLGIDLLYQDLTLGGVSYWDFYGNSDYMPLNTNQTWFTFGAKYWTTRQVIHYNRPGSVRVSAVPNDAMLRTLAFTNGGNTSVVIINTTTGNVAKNVLVTGIPPGTYGYSETTGSGTHTELGLLTVADNGTVTVPVAQNMVVALYPHTANLPPLAISWAANPTYLDLPASSVALSASAQDPELSAVTYHWKVDSFPTGAAVVLSNSNISNPTVTGMSVAGNYVFAVQMSDGSDTTIKLVTVQVFPGNQAPIISALQSRIPVIITLPIDTTILQGFCFDIEGDALTYLWTIVSEPVGASAQLVTPTAANRCTVRNMTVAGNYVFNYAVSDPTHTASRNITVPVFPLNDTPVITSVSATPRIVNSTSGLTTLSAITSDPNNDVITHWWTVVSAPAGANPVFAWQGERTNGVSGLIVPGTYVFMLTVVDRTLYTQKNDTVTVVQTTCPTASVTTGSATCGQSNGSATVRLQDSTSYYSYVWSAPANDTFNIATNLSAGSYSVTVTGNGCSVTASGIVSNIGGASAYISAQANPLCAGDSGSAIVSASGGSGSLTYSWSSGANTPMASGLAAGIYTVTIKDANNCQTIIADTVIAPPVLTVVISQSSPLLLAHVTGGTAPYSYQWNGAGISDSILNNILFGIDSVIVTDHNGCTAGAIFAVTSATPITAGITSFNLYPNPSNGFFTANIQMASVEDLTLSIADITGRDIYKSIEKNVTNLSKYLCLGNRAKGIYLVTLKTFHGTTSQRIIIE